MTTLRACVACSYFDWAQFQQTAGAITAVSSFTPNIVCLPGLTLLKQYTEFIQFVLRDLPRQHPLNSVQVTGISTCATIWVETFGKQGMADGENVN